MSYLIADVKLELLSTNNFGRKFAPRRVQFTGDYESFDAAPSLTTTAVQLQVLNLADGWAFFQNVSASSDAVVRVGADVGGAISPFGRLKHKEWATFPVIPDTTYMAQMEAGAGILYYGLYGTAEIIPSTGTMALSWSQLTAGEWDTLTAQEWSEMTV